MKAGGHPVVGKLLPCSKPRGRSEPQLELIHDTLRTQLFISVVFFHECDSGCVFHCFVWPTYIFTVKFTSHPRGEFSSLHIVDFFTCYIVRNFQFRPFIFYSEFNSRWSVKTRTFMSLPAYLYLKEVLRLLPVVQKDTGRWRADVATIDKRGRGRNGNQGNADLHCSSYLPLSLVSIGQLVFCVCLSLKSYQRSRFWFLRYMFKCESVVSGNRNKQEVQELHI